MYAITATNCRAIADASDLQRGETAVDELPLSLLAFMQCDELRRQRDAMLATCDWTQGVDSPLDATKKAAWATYRTALRDVPQQSGFPGSISWPSAP